MKNISVKRVLAVAVSAVAMFAATMSSSMCLWWVYEESEMPKSLIKED